MIYAIQVLDPFERIKIGYTDRDLASRITQMRTACPYQLRVLGTVEGSADAEAELHHRFAEHSVLGEWFEPAQEILDFFANGDQQVIGTYGRDVADSNRHVRFLIPSAMHTDVERLARFRNSTFRAALIFLLEKGISSERHRWEE